MSFVILFFAGAIILVVWLAVRHSAGGGPQSHPPHRPDTGGDAPWMGTSGHLSHYPCSDERSSPISDAGGEGGSGDPGGGDCGGGGDGGGGGSD
jgi:hypothetical protein